MEIEQQIKSAKRELNMREHTYPRWVAAGRISQARADHEIEAMKAIIETLEGVAAGRKLL